VVSQVEIDMSAYEMIAALRQQKFPDCTRMAIEQLATIYVHGGITTIPGLATNADEIEEQIVAEFIIFKNTKKVSNRRLLGMVIHLVVIALSDQFLPASCLVYLLIDAVFIRTWVTSYLSVAK
jgi:hypothetical protein